MHHGFLPSVGLKASWWKFNSEIYRFYFMSKHLMQQIAQERARQRGMLAITERDPEDEKKNDEYQEGSFNASAPAIFFTNIIHCSDTTPYVKRRDVTNKDIGIDHLRNSLHFPSISPQWPLMDSHIGRVVNGIELRVEAINAPVVDKNTRIR